MAQILVNNLVGVKGEISTIKESGRPWTSNETLYDWIKKYPNRNTSEYHRNYTLIIIPDKPVDDLLYLIEQIVGDDDLPIGSAYHFIEPPKDGDEWGELFSTGQITKPWAEVELYLEAFS